MFARGMIMAYLTWYVHQNTTWNYMKYTLYENEKLNLIYIHYLLHCVSQTRVMYIPYILPRICLVKLKISCRGIFYQLAPEMKISCRSSTNRLKILNNDLMHKCYIVFISWNENLKFNYSQMVCTKSHLTPVMWL